MSQDRTQLTASERDTIAESAMGVASWLQLATEENLKAFVAQMDEQGMDIWDSIGDGLAESFKDEARYITDYYRQEPEEAWGVANKVDTAADIVQCVKDSNKDT